MSYKHNPPLAILDTKVPLTQTLYQKWFKVRVHPFCLSWQPKSLAILFAPSPQQLASFRSDESNVTNVTLNWNEPWLLHISVPIWKVHRKLLTPAFSQGVLDGFIEVFNSQAKKLVGSLNKEEGQKPFDFWTYMGPNALETIFCKYLKFKWDKLR